ncbi:hypothetical protein [Nonomuraea typhae]|uniref:hypothetical protein n=1 Tax=Nonomuraea typhae TaxID=2603600 RepID=UPI0012F978FA|nr:hypothetical protein [Nonomuraea typhae]
MGDKPLMIVPLPVDATLFCALVNAACAHAEQLGHVLTTADMRNEETVWGTAVTFRMPEEAPNA